MKKEADLRTCAHCEWIFRKSDTGDSICPECGFVSYGAFFVYGRKAYRYELTQEPWLRKEQDKLISKIWDSDSFKKAEERRKARLKEKEVLKMDDWTC